MSRPENGFAGTSRQLADDGGFNVYLALHEFNPRSENPLLFYATFKVTGAARLHRAASC